MPYNTFAHNALLQSGYTHEHHNATWEDVGDAENGPKLDGGPACDVYASETEYVVIDEDGSATRDVEGRAMDSAYEKMEAEWATAPSN